MTKKRACIYTCQFGGYDKVSPIQADCDCLLITDTPQERPGWTTIVVGDLGFGSPRRNSRYYKLNSHKLEYEYTIYIDARCHFNGPVRWQELITDHYLSAFPHYMRNCLYDEADAVRRFRMADPSLVHQTTQKYKAAGFPAQFGLSENAFLVRRQCPDLTEIEKAWWYEYINGTQRDQLHLMYVLWQQGKNYLPYPLPGTVHQNTLFKTPKRPKA